MNVGRRLGHTYGMLLTLIGVAMIAKPVNYAVMIHGAGGGGWEYDKWRPVFEKANWVVVAKDLQPAKHGLKQTKFTDYLRQVESWAALENAGRVVYVGASMGGILALKASERIKPDAIVLVNSVPPAGLNEAFASRHHPAVVRWANGPLKDTRDAMPDSDEQTILWAHKRWRDESGAVLNEISKGISVKAVDCPILVIAGGKDTDVPPSEAIRIAKRFRGELRTYSDLSHVGPLLGTSAGLVARDTVEWLQKAVPR